MTIILVFLSILIKSISGSFQCATLRATDSAFQNEEFIAKDGSVFGNFGQEYISANQSWNVPATWTINPSCELQSCSDVSLNGVCTSFPAGTQSPSNAWLSARCKCNRECTCSNVFMKRSICARAYLQSGGCKNCHAKYTELSTDLDDASFPEEWKANVSSLLVRSGCKLTVYDEEGLEGDLEEIVGPINKRWNGQFGSYECECDENDNSQVAPITNQPTTQAIHVPDSIDGVISNLAQNNFNHVGLLAALSSLTRGRSSKNVYLLMIGSSGAGKSSAINNLLGTTMTAEGDHESMTSDILEFRVPLSVPELNIANSELRIIDTPGLGDTRGLQNDASFLATLDEYLTNHEDLKTKIPNLVLIFHNFNDNRFGGEGAQFVRMIRALDTLRSRITDESYSNVLFVFSHLCTADRKLQYNPSPKLLMFKEVIEMYSFFPKPLQTVAIENKGRENELLMRNYNYELPNKELFPQNLFQKFLTITEKSKDKIGNAVLENLKVLRYQETINNTQVTFPLVISSHPKVAKYVSALNSAAFAINSTQISNLLAEAHKSMTTSLAAKFPKCLQNLQRYLNLKNIKSISDVPRTSTAILELISGIEQNDAISYLLETALDLKSPEFPANPVTGQSFDVFKNAILPVSPFKMDARKVSIIGFGLPTIIRCTKSLPTFKKKPVNTFKIFDTKRQYFQDISSFLLGTKLSTVANSTELFSILTSKANDGYFVREMRCVGTSNAVCFTVTRAYKRFQFDLEIPTTPNPGQLQPDLLSRIRNIGRFEESNYQSVEEWTNFFNDFGTHVVKSADGGGRIDIHFTLSKEASPEIAVNTVLKALDFADDPLGSLETYREDPSGVFASVANINHTLVFRGGNQAYHFSDVSKLTLDQAYHLMKKWKESLSFYPAVFPKEIVPIGEVIGNYILDNERVEILEKIENALCRLLSSTLKYVEPTPDPKILEELERQRREQEERLRQMEADAERKRQEAERLRLAEIEAQQRREREARELEEKRRREAEAAERKRRQEEEERQRRLREEEERRLREQREAEIRHQQYLQSVREEQMRREEELRRELERQQREEEERRNRHWTRRLKRFFKRHFR